MRPKSSGVGHQPGVVLRKEDSRGDVDEEGDPGERRREDEDGEKRKREAEEREGQDEHEERVLVVIVVRLVQFIACDVAAGGDDGSEGNEEVRGNTRGGGRVEEHAYEGMFGEEGGGDGHEEDEGKG